MALTARQKQIKKLLDQKKSAEQIGKSLGITTNAVYQQIRRMRASGAAVSTPSGNGGRQSARKAHAKASKSKPRLTPAPAPKPAPAPAPTPVAAQPTTPLQSVRARRDEIQGLVKEAEAAVTIAQRELDGAKAQAEKVASRHADELKALDKAEAALRPKPAAPAKPKGTANATQGNARQTTPKPAAATSGTNGQGGSNGAEAAPAAPEGAETPAAA